MTKRISKAECTAYAITDALKEIKGSVELLYKLADEEPKNRKFYTELLQKYKVLAYVFRDTVRNDSFTVDQDEEQDEDSHILTQEEILATLNHRQ